MMNHVILPFLLITAITCCGGAGKPKYEQFILPNGYSGPVVVIFNDAKGCDPTVLDDTIFFQIPSNGICVVKGDQSYGILNLSVSYSDGSKIPFVQRWEDMGQGLTYAHSYSVGSHGLSPDNLKTISFIIGNRDRVQSDIDDFDRFNPFDFMDTYEGCSKER